MELLADLDWNRVLMSGLIGGAIGGLVGLFAYLFKKPEPPKNSENDAQ